MKFYLFLLCTFLFSCQSRHAKEPCLLFVPESKSHLIANGFKNTVVKGDVLERDFSRRNGDTLENITIEDYKKKIFHKNIYISKGMTTKRQAYETVLRTFKDIIIKNDDNMIVLVRESGVVLNITIMEAFPGRVSMNYLNYNNLQYRTLIHGYWQYFFKVKYPGDFEKRYAELISKLL
jgi:hypothetical protein